VWCLFTSMREACCLEAGDALNRRQSMTTWGILGLAVFVSVGMAEWSKRSAMEEKVISSAVMEEALQIAAAAGSGSRVAGGELPATSHPKRATLRSDSEANIQTSAGGEK
jgi:hypothetical protein